jgi:repressor LexA
MFVSFQLSGACPSNDRSPHAATLNKAATLNNPEALNNAAATNDAPSTVLAGYPEEAEDGCVRLDAGAVLRATPRSFALRVRGDSMVEAGIRDGDIIVGDLTPQARPGAIVVALIDGASTLKRFILRDGQPVLASGNPACPEFHPLHELVIQGVVHTVVRRVG